MPLALSWGLSDYQFWHEEPYLMISYSKSYELKQKQWQEKTNFTAWLEGVYIQNAVASVLSKNSKYPSKPFDLYENEISDNGLKSSENAIKERSRIINEQLKMKS